jgi:hypothetical protein
MSNHEPPRKSILETERSRKMVELILNKGCKPDLSGVCLARLDLSSLNMPSIALVGSDLRSVHLPKTRVVTIAFATRTRACNAMAAPRGGVLRLALLHCER